MLKHYVTFLFPGSFYPEESTKEISSREEKIDAPENCFAYEFWDRNEIEQDGEILRGKAINKSGRYYFGEVFDQQQVADLVPDNSTLLFNMKCNGWDKLIKTRKGNWQPLMPEDVVVTQ